MRCFTTKLQQLVRSSPPGILALPIDGRLNLEINLGPVQVRLRNQVYLVQLRTVDRDKFYLTNVGSARPPAMMMAAVAIEGYRSRWQEAARLNLHAGDRRTVIGQQIVAVILAVRNRDQVPVADQGGHDFDLRAIAHALGIAPQDWARRFRRPFRKQVRDAEKAGTLSKSVHPPSVAPSCATCVAA